MAKKKDETPVKEDEDIGVVGRTPLLVHRQYLKDLSFENPNSPGILHRIEAQPVMDMDIAIDVQKLDHEEFENYYEVILKLNANAVREKEAMFIADIDYAAAVSIEGLEPKQHHPLLFIEVPQLLFPFARQILANITQSGAFMPLQIAPVNFRQMYLQRFGDKLADKEKKAS
ncbi:MAG: protein-export chaperone SecB [Pseudomonadota bacterium]